MHKVKSYKYYVLWGVLFSLCFGGAMTSLRFICYAICITLFCFCFVCLRKEDKQLTKYNWRYLPLLFCFAIVSNIISCMINRNQEISLSLKNSEYLYLFYFLFFYVFVVSKISVKKLRMVNKSVILHVFISLLIGIFCFLP